MRHNSLSDGGPGQSGVSSVGLMCADLGVILMLHDQSCNVFCMGMVAGIPLTKVVCNCVVL